MSEFPYHEKLQLRNFTAFSDCTLEFCSGINAFVGENGTGKTHVMKALFAWQRHKKGDQITGWPSIITDVFQAEDQSNLVRLGEGIERAEMFGVYGGRDWNEACVRDATKHSFSDHYWQEPEIGSPVFIPATEMMGHTKNFLSTYRLYKIDFDLTQHDIVELLLAPPLRNGSSENQLMEKLQDCLGGEVRLEGERFYLVTSKGKLPMPIVGEGLRKIATLVQLVRNGFLVPGATLFWDEPEVNANPVLMDELIGAILALARHGVQVFLATHSYLILKELEVQSNKKDCTRFFSFKASEEGTVVSTSDTYLGLSPNPIEEQYSSLYDCGIQKRIRDLG